MLAIARCLDFIPAKALELEARYTFCLAPVNTGDPWSLASLVRYATDFAEQACVQLQLDPNSVWAIPRSPTELAQLERLSAALGCYQWLGGRFPYEFVDCNTAKRLQADVDAKIIEGIAKISLDRATMASRSGNR